MQENIEQLIVEGAKVKAKMAQLSDRLKQISTVLDQAAEFKDGSKTGYLVGGGFKVKVVRRDNTKWDQKNLAVIRGYHNFQERFGQAFKAEYKPKSAKELEKAMLLDAEFEKAVNWSRKITPGAPGVTFEHLESEGGE
jgi:hypothetical protein